MSKEFDQSTFDLGMHGFSYQLDFTPDYQSDVPQVEPAPNYFLSNAVACSPFNQPQSLKNINDRIKTENYMLYKTGLT